MKKQFLKTMLVAGTTMFFFACSSGGGNKTADAEAENDYSEETEESPAEEASEQSGQMIIVWHEVEDYDTWRPLYDANLPSIVEGGMSRSVVGRENGNENNVMVGQVVHDIDAARAFNTSEDLKTKMEEAGVSGEPTIAIVDVVSYGGAYHDNLERVMVRYKIRDWDTFKPIFDAAVANEGEPGLQFLFLSRDTDDSNMITVVNIVVDREKAEAYIESEDLKGKMEEATVEGDVLIRYFTAEYIDDSSS